MRGARVIQGARRNLRGDSVDGSGAEPVLGKPTSLFADVYDFGQGLSIPNYDVTSDGRFLIAASWDARGDAARRPELDRRAEADACASEWAMRIAGPGMGEVLV